MLAKARMARLSEVAMRIHVVLLESSFGRGVCSFERWYGSPRREDLA